MSGPTALVRYVLAQTSTRAGLMHLSSERSTGALNPVCGASQLRGKEINTWPVVAADLSALCADCAAFTLSIPDVESVEQGLAMFLAADPAAPSSARLLELPATAIAVQADAHRAVDEDSEAFGQLVQSVLERGLLQPIVVRRTTAGPQLVIGRRRLAAVIAAGLELVPVIVRDVTDEQATLDALSENLHRTNLNPIEQAFAYQRALEQLEVTQGDMAKRLHLSQAQVSNTIRLLGLPAHLREHVASGALSAAHARELLRLPQGEEQDALAAAILDEGLSVKDTAARRAAVPAAVDPDLERLVAALTRRFDAPVSITPKPNHTTRIVLDVPDAELTRVLTQLGIQATA